MQNPDGLDFSSRKVTSRKEEAELRRVAPAMSMAGVSPSQYMEISKGSYYEEFEKPKGSIYTQTLNTQTYNGGEETAKLKLSKQRQFLRRLRFGFIKDSYNNVMSSGSSQRKLTIAMYAIPAALSFGLALSNYA